MGFGSLFPHGLKRLLHEFVASELEIFVVIAFRFDVFRGGFLAELSESIFRISSVARFPSPASSFTNTSTVPFARSAGRKLMVNAFLLSGGRRSSR